MQRRTVWVVLMTFRQSEKPEKVGEFSKETKIADGHDYPLLLVLRLLSAGLGAGSLDV